MNEALAPPLVRWQDMTIVARQPRTPNITSFFFKPSQPVTWRAGQHVDVRLTSEDGHRAIRSYSIASPPGLETLELAIERLPDGEVSPFFHDIAIVGDTIELKAPLGGHFVWESRDGGPLFLAAGGSGLVPVMSMIRHRAATASTAPVQLLLSARTWDDVLYRDELLDLAARGDGFGVAFALTREAPRRSQDFARRVDAAMVASVLGRLPAWPHRVFVCGANGFVNAAADGAVAAGVAANLIRTERYGGA
jgi:ferredoxin-NADP reductase